MVNKQRILHGNAHSILPFKKGASFNTSALLANTYAFHHASEPGTHNLSNLNKKLIWCCVQTLWVENKKSVVQKLSVTLWGGVTGSFHIILKQSHGIPCRNVQWTCWLCQNGLVTQWIVPHVVQDGIVMTQRSYSKNYQSSMDLAVTFYSIVTRIHLVSSTGVPSPNSWTCSHFTIPTLLPLFSTFSSFVTYDLFSIVTVAYPLSPNLVTFAPIRTAWWL